MTKGLGYKGYTGSMEISREDDCLYGSVQYVNDLITYEGDTPAQLEQAFKAAVDRYLAHCEATGKRPDKACSGNLNVRLKPELHRKAASKAVLEGCSLNDFIVRAIERAIDPALPQRVVHEHVMIVEELQPVGSRVVTTNEAGISWGLHGTAH